MDEYERFSQEAKIAKRETTDANGFRAFDVMSGRLVFRCGGLLRGLVNRCQAISDTGKNNWLGVV